MNLENCKAKTVWRLFGELSDIPRPSKHEQRVCEWLEKFAERHDLAHRRDEEGNMVLVVPATEGCEGSDGIVLQSHTDMVCEKTPESSHDFFKDGIRLVEKEGWMYADQTTLGADNGIGVAMALATATELKEPHGRIELLFTVDEETGLTGVNALQDEFIQGTRLINLDSEDEGVLTIGCAGGIQSDLTLGIEREKIADGQTIACITIAKLKGGHSGVNIIEQRANAIVLLGRVLGSLGQAFEIRLGDITGGSAANAIPRDAAATFVFDQKNLSSANEILKSAAAEIKTQFAQTDPDLSITMEQMPSETIDRVTTTPSSAVVVDLLNALPDGVHRMSKKMAGIVETSSNVAGVRVNPDRDEFIVTMTQRSLSDASLEYLTSRIEAASRLAGAAASRCRQYPSWQPRWDSPLLSTCKQVYEQQSTRPATVEVIHAGLECAVIGKKYRDLDMISIGPTIEDPHSPKERVNIESVDQVWDFLKALIVRLK